MISSGLNDSIDRQAESELTVAGIALAPGPIECLHRFIEAFRYTIESVKRYGVEVVLHRTAYRTVKYRGFAVRLVENSRLVAILVPLH